MSLKKKNGPSCTGLSDLGVDNPRQLDKEILRLYRRHRASMHTEDYLGKSSVN